MTDCLHFRVYGDPVPQGSVSAYGGHIVGVPAKLRKWRDNVRIIALDQYGRRPPHDGPVGIHVLFILPKPKRPRWDVPAVTPDLDKLARAVGDALTHTKAQPGVLVNDSRIVAWHAAKVYGDHPGALVTIDFNYPLPDKSQTDYSGLIPTEPPNL
jgi:crossover junction endodeoxyribonuclease RusA